MKTFEQYHETRQIAELLIQNNINLNLFGETILELAKKNQLNENSLANWMRGASNWIKPKVTPPPPPKSQRWREPVPPPITTPPPLKQKQTDLQTSAGIMQNIQIIDNKLKALGYKVNLNKLTFGAVEKAMAKWSEITHRGDDPHAVRAKVMQDKARTREQLRKNPTQTINPQYDPNLYNTTTSMPANATSQSNIGADYEDTLNHSATTNDNLKDVLNHMKKNYGKASIPRTKKQKPISPYDDPHSSLFDTSKEINIQYDPYDDPQRGR